MAEAPAPAAEAGQPSAGAAIAALGGPEMPAMSQEGGGISL